MTIVKFDFGPNTLAASSGFNSVSDGSAGDDKVANSTDTAGAATPISLDFLDLFAWGSLGGADPATLTSGAAAWARTNQDTADASNDGFGIQDGNTVRLRLRGVPSSTASIGVYGTQHDTRDGLPAMENTVSVNGSASVVVPANLNYDQSAVFTDVAADGDGNYIITINSSGGFSSALNALYVEYEEANTAPTATDDTATTDEDTPVNIDVLSNDSDADGDTLSVTAASATNGTVVIETDNTLTYTPNSGFTGSDTVTYTVSDGTDTANATVTVTVNAASSGGGSSLTAPIGSPSAQSQLIDEITVAGPLFNGIISANPGLDLVGLGAFAEVITGTPTYDLATGSWETLAEDTEWDVYVYNGAWSAASRVSASAGQASTDVGGGTVNTPATGQPTITGTPEVGETLTADTSGIADTDGLGTLNIQWLLDGSPINGATNTTYIPVVGDVGSDVSVRVSFTDGEGNAEGPLTSSAVTIQAAPVSNTPTSGLPVITGTAQVGLQLGVDTSALADVDGLGAFTYSWRLDGSEVGTAATYTPNATGSLLVRVSHTDGGGTVETVSSAAVTVQPTPAGITEDSGNPIPASITVPAGGSYDLKQHFVIPNGSTAVFTVISGLLGQGVSMTSLGVLSNTGAAATTNSVSFNVEAA